MPKSVQPKAKAHLNLSGMQACPAGYQMAETKAEANAAFDFFIEG